MYLDPNQYKYVVRSLKVAIKNNAHKTITDVCAEISVVNHIPIVAVLLLCQHYIDKDKERSKLIKQLIKFYKYTNIKEILSEVSEVSKSNPGDRE